MHPDASADSFSYKAPPTSEARRGNDEADQAIDIDGQSMLKPAKAMRIRPDDAEAVQGHGAAGHGQARQDEDPVGTGEVGHGQASCSSVGPTEAQSAPRQLISCPLAYPGPSPRQWFCSSDKPSSCG
jgi:hypothetical protein